MQEINSGKSKGVEKGTKERIRKEGGGRKRVKEKYPNIETELEKMLEPVKRGDPESPLLWTCKSTYRIAKQLQESSDIKVSQRTVCDLLSDLGYSLQSNRKANEGGNHQDRNAQFYYIYDKVKEFQKKEEPVIFANETGLNISICHFPPGTSKWNKIEHRMFCHISKNWRATPLISREVVVNLISNTTTTKGLKIITNKE